MSFGHNWLLKCLWLLKGRQWSSQEDQCCGISALVCPYVTSCFSSQYTVCEQYNDSINEDWLGDTGTVEAHCFVICERRGFYEQLHTT